MKAAGDKALEVELPQLETLLLGSLGRQGTAIPATTSRLDTSRVEVLGPKAKEYFGERPSFKSSFTHRVLEHLRVPGGERWHFVVLAHCDIQVGFAELLRKQLSLSCVPLVNKISKVHYCITYVECCCSL